MNDSKDKYPADPMVSIADVIKSLYLTLLGREISEADLNQQLFFYSQNDFSAARAIENIARSEEFSIGVESFLSRYNVNFTKQTWQSLSNQTNTAIIAVLDEVWLPFCLAIADWLYEEYSINSLFVSYGKIPYKIKSIKTSKSDQGILYIDDLNQLPEGFEPAVIVVHSFGWGDNTHKLMNKFPYSPLLVYGDGYKNSASLLFDNLRPVQNVVMFGFDDESCPEVSHTIIGSKSVNLYRKLLSDIYPFSQLRPDLEPEQYSVFYIRYWGRGVYSGLSNDKIIEIWKRTVIPNLPVNNSLIIKNDPRVNVELYELCVECFKAEGVNVIPFEKYLLAVGSENAQLGLLPVEYFYLNGLLCSANAHFTLDSALSYSLAVQPNIRRPCKIFLGADDFLLSTVDDSLVIENIQYSVGVYSKGLLESAEVGTVVSIKTVNSLLRCFELRV